MSLGPFTTILTPAFSDEDITVEYVGSYEEGPEKGCSKYRATCRGVYAVGYGTNGVVALRDLIKAMRDRRDQAALDPRVTVTVGRPNPFYELIAKIAKIR